MDIFGITHYEVLCSDKAASNKQEYNIICSASHIVHCSSREAAVSMAMWSVALFFIRRVGRVGWAADHFIKSHG